MKYKINLSESCFYKENFMFNSDSVIFKNISEIIQELNNFDSYYASRNDRTHFFYKTLQAIEIVYERMLSNNLLVQFKLFTESSYYNSKSGSQPLFYIYPNSKDIHNLKAFYKNMTEYRGTGGYSLPYPEQNTLFIVDEHIAAFCNYFKKLKDYHDFDIEKTMNSVNHLLFSLYTNDANTKEKRLVYYADFCKQENVIFRESCVNVDLPLFQHVEFIYGNESIHFNSYFELEHLNPSNTFKVKEHQLSILINLTILKFKEIFPDNKVPLNGKVICTQNCMDIQSLLILNSQLYVFLKQNTFFINGDNSKTPNKYKDIFSFVFESLFSLNNENITTIVNKIHPVLNSSWEQYIINGCINTEEDDKQDTSGALNKKRL